MSNPELVYVCEICQTILDAHNCKATCPNCGRMLDCSDLPFMGANARYDADHGGLTLRPGSDPRDWLPNTAPDQDSHTDAGANDDAESVRDLP